MNCDYLGTALEQIECLCQLGGVLARRLSTPSIAMNSGECAGRHLAHHHPATTRGSLADAESPADQVADPRARARPEVTHVARCLRPGLDQPGEFLVLHQAEPRRWAGRLAGPQRLGTGGVVPPKPLVHCRPRHLELRRDGERLLAIELVPYYVDVESAATATAGSEPTPVTAVPTMTAAAGHAVRFPR